jgi:WD40 repeat protein
VKGLPADTGQQGGPPLTGHLSSVQSVAFSPDGHRIVSGSADYTLRLWPGRARQDLCAWLTANLRGKQWREWVSPDIPYMRLCDDLPIPPDEPEEN